MIVECPSCGTKNRIPDPPRKDSKYRCGSCKRTMEIPYTGSAKQQSDSMPPSKELIAEFITALDQEIEAIKAGKGGSVVRVFDGRFIRERSGIFVYSFMLENFIATIDDAPVEVQVKGSRYQGQIIQTQGLEVIIGVEHNLGPSIPEARLITNLYFLHEMLKKKFEAVHNDELSGDFTLANLVFESKALNPPRSVALPPLEPHPKKIPNDSQLKAIKVSQGLPLTLVWGPPGTGKTETLARIVECFIKRGMKVLVVAHANAAVDEATEDVAEILKATEYYNRGQIIRLGNYQKKTLETDYDLVLLEKIAERLGATLKREKEQLEQQKSEIERNLTQLASASEAIQERETLSRQIKQFTDSLMSSQREIAQIKTQIAQQENHLRELQAKLHKAESSGALKRFLLGLDPVRIRQEIDRATVRLDSTRRQLRERESRLQEIEQQKSGAEARLYTVQQRIGSFLTRFRGLSEPRLRSREQELHAEKSRILARISEIQKELDELQKRVLSEARVICATLTKTFSAKEFPDTPFDVLVVDEASMAPMPYLYWALSRCRRAAVIVGDFLQLPPICIAEEGMAQRWLGRSIYQHLQLDTVSKAKQDNRVCLLDTQYRMNPVISAIPNQMFYQGLLSDDSSTRSQVVSEGLSRSPLTIIDMTSASPWCSRLRSGGRFNVYSALLAATTAKKILESAGSNGYQVGIISPYAAQARLIGKILKDMGLERQVRVATVHRFQGGEAQIIIFDTVEGPGVKVAPMLDDTKDDSDAPLLLNVAMTRAKCKIFLIANLEYLKSELSTETVLHRIISAFERNGQRIDCRDLVDSYFIRDFERWIEQLLKSSGGMPEPPSGSLFNEKNFYPAFFEDLRRAQEEVIILSPFVSTRRSGQFIELFRILIQKGVRVRLFTRPAKEQTGNFALNAAQVIEQMRAIDVEVTERKRMHKKVAIIDRSIAWEGSLNILSHRDSDEQMRRLPFATAVNELVRLCELEESSEREGHGKTEPVRTFEECPECGEEMVIRVSKYGPFLSCPDRSCSGKRNINKWDRIKTHTLCPNCGQPMMLRRSPKGYFLGCSAYPNCRKTLPIR